MASRPFADFDFVDIIVFATSLRVKARFKWDFPNIIRVTHIHFNKGFLQFRLCIEAIIKIATFTSVVQFLEFNRQCSNTSVLPVRTLPSSQITSV